MKIKGLIIIISVAVLMFLLMGAIYRKIGHLEKVAREVATLPSFRFQKLDGSYFTDDSLGQTTGGAICINYFNPECDHCQYMAKTFVNDSARLRNLHLLMVALADSAEVAGFRRDYHLDLLRNVTICRDTKDSFPALFGNPVVPTFFIYKDKKLVKKIVGETKIENILDATH